MGKIVQVINEIIHQEISGIPCAPGSEYPGSQWNKGMLFALERLRDQILRRDWTPLEASETRELRRALREKHQRVLDLEAEVLGLEAIIKTLLKVKPEVCSTSDVLRKIADALEGDHEELGIDWRFARD